MKKEHKENGLRQDHPQIKMDDFAIKPEDSTMMDKEHNSASTGFSLEKYRVSQDFPEMAMVKQILTTVRVGKPTPQSYVQFHKDDSYSMKVCLLHIKEDNEFYLVSPDIAHQIMDECNMYTLFTYAIRGGGVGIWPVRLFAADGKSNPWWDSAREVIDVSSSYGKWVRVRSNQSIGAYEAFAAQSVLEEPIWPEKSFSDLAGIAFKGRLIDAMDHPVLRRLRGEF